MPDSLIAYYFSGTGNAESVAHIIDKEAKKKKRESTLVNIAELPERNKISKPEADIIGFISPTHGFNFPPIMMHFLFRFPRANKKKAFIVNTRAGMKMGKLFLPGISGMAQYLFALLLWLKGYKVIGMHPIDLPSNWISLHPGLKQKVVKSIFKRREKESRIFAQKILSGQKDLKALHNIIQDILISPVALLYYFFGRFFLAKSFIASKDCTKCNLCIIRCPVKAISYVDKRPFWSYRCESCMQCMNACPERAIETAHGFMAGVLAISYSVVLYYLYDFFDIQQYLQTNFSLIVSKAAIYILECVVIMTILMISCYLVHLLMRFRFFEHLIVFTSLSKLPNWRRYRKPKR